MAILSPILLLIQVTLMILLEGFLVISIFSLTKNPSRRIINVTWRSKRMGLKCKSAQKLLGTVYPPHSNFDDWICSTDKRLIGSEIHILGTVHGVHDSISNFVFTF